MDYGETPRGPAAAATDGGQYDAETTPVSGSVRDLKTRVSASPGNRPAARAGAFGIGAIVEKRETASVVEAICCWKSLRPGVELKGRLRRLPPYVGQGRAPVNTDPEPRRF